MGDSVDASFEGDARSSWMGSFTSQGEGLILFCIFWRDGYWQITVFCRDHNNIGLIANLAIGLLSSEKAPHPMEETFKP
jgi:hypothetical protein